MVRNYFPSISKLELVGVAMGMDYPIPIPCYDFVEVNQTKVDPMNSSQADTAIRVGTEDEALEDSRLGTTSKLRIGDTGERPAEGAEEGVNRLTRGASEQEPRAAQDTSSHCGQYRRGRRRRAPRRDAAGTLPH